MHGPLRGTQATVLARWSRVTDRDRNHLVLAHERTPGISGFDTEGGIYLANVRLTDMGRMLHRLMGLTEVPDHDLDEIASALHGPCKDGQTARASGSRSARNLRQRTLTVPDVRRRERRLTDHAGLDDGVKVDAAATNPPTDVHRRELSVVDPLSGLPDYAESDSWSSAASGGVVFRVRIIRAL